MKKFLTIFSLLISILMCHAQDSSWGIKASFDINIPTKLGGRLNGEKLDLFRTGYGGALGAVYTHWFNNSIFVEPGASVFYDSYSYKDLIIMDVPAGLTEADPSLAKLGIRIPLVVGYAYDFLETLPMRVYTGPELSYALYGRVHFKNKALLDDGLDISLFGENGFMKRMDCAWKIGIGFDTEIATICIDASIGMADLYKDHLTMHENRLIVSLIRYF